MERRDQQNLNLIKNTNPTFNSKGNRQSVLTSEGGGTSWQIRISLRAQDKTCVFSNLMKHINIDTLKEAFKAIDGKKALGGVDNVTKSDYGKNLEEMEVFTVRSHPVANLGAT